MVSTTSTNERVERLRISAPLLLALLGLATLCVAAYGRAAFAFWPDEAYSVLAARARDWNELLLINLRNEETPPLYFALLRLWALAWGDSREATLRLFSAVCLAATVPLVGWLGWRVWSRDVGLISALLLTVNPFSRYYGQETRAYALALLFATIVFLAAHCYLRRPGPRSWAIYILAGTAALYTNYFAAFILAGVGGVVGLALLRDFWQHRERKRGIALAGWVVAQALILVMLVPWLPALRYQVTFSQATLAPEGRNIWLQYLLSLLALGGSTPDGSLIGSALIVLLAIALLAAGALVLGRGTIEQRLFVVATIVIPMLCVLLVFHGDGQFAPRYMLLSLPGYVALLAAGLLQGWRGQALTRALLLAIVALSAIYCFSAKPNVRRLGGWDAMARQVEAQAEPGDALFFAPPWAQAPFVVQYAGAPLPLHGASSFAEYYYEQGNSFNQPIDATALDRQLQRGRRAWIVWDHIYAVHPPAIANTTVTEYTFGSTSLLLVTPAAKP